MGTDILRVGPDKFFARPISLYRRKETIVSLERWVCSCAELQVFSRYRGWKKHVKRSAQFQQHGDTSCQPGIFSARQGAEGNSRHSDRNITYATVKNWLTQFKRGDFSICDALRTGRPKTVTTTEIIVQIHELILEGLRISAISIAEQPDISRERIGSIITEIWTCGSSPRSGSRNVWRRIKTSKLPVDWANIGIFSAPSKWFSVAIVDHGRNVVISLWPGDKATINGVAA